MALTLAKSNRPDAGEALLREHLFTRLDTTHNCLIVRISAPASTENNKTPLISSYIESKNDSNMWYRVNAGNANMAAFFHF